MINIDLNYLEKYISHFKKPMRKGWEDLPREELLMLRNEEMSVWGRTRFAKALEEAIEPERLWCVDEVEESQFEEQWKVVFEEGTTRAEAEDAIGRIREQMFGGDSSICPVMLDERDRNVVVFRIFKEVRVECPSGDRVLRLMPTKVDRTPLGHFTHRAINDTLVEECKTRPRATDLATIYHNLMKKLDEGKKTMSLYHTDQLLRVADGMAQLLPSKLDAADFLALEMEEGKFKLLGFAPKRFAFKSSRFVIRPYCVLERK